MCPVGVAAKPVPVSGRPPRVIRSAGANSLDHGGIGDIDTQQAPSEAPTSHGKRTAVNWILAILTAPAALAVVIYAYLQVLGTAGCSSGTCGGVGPSETVFGLVEYGAPVIAVAAVLLSFVTARRRWGIVVPVIALAAIIAAAAVLFTTF
jgi:hypothetical protein